jgi:putative exosortase-associated protein (TIGR04073 family)
MKKILVIFCAVVLVLSFSITMFAANMPVKSYEKKEDPSAKVYPMGPYQKAERGICNILWGVTEIPKTVVEVANETDNPILGIIIGMPAGLGRAVARIFSGVVDVITFPIGRYDKPMILPEMDIDTGV